MESLVADYRENVAVLRARLRVGESFDLIERRLLVGQDELTAFYPGKILSFLSAPMFCPT